MNTLESEIWKVEKIIVRAEKEGGSKEIFKYSYEKAFPKKYTVSKLLKTRLNNLNFPGYTFTVLEKNNRPAGPNKQLINLEYSKDPFVLAEEQLKRAKRKGIRLKEKAENIRNTNTLLSEDRLILEEIIPLAYKLSKLVLYPNIKNIDCDLYGKAYEIASKIKTVVIEDKRLKELIEDS